VGAVASEHDLASGALAVGRPERASVPEVELIAALHRDDLHDFVAVVDQREDERNA
jgi:hypothetical protein